MKKILENHELKNKTLQERTDISAFKKTAIHYFHEEGEKTWLAWYDILTRHECDIIHKMFQIDNSFITRQRQSNR